MSLLKWKELAKSKSELGNKINYVHNAIEKHDIDQQTSQQGFSKVFKPITSKLDDVIDSNQVLRMPKRSFDFHVCLYDSPLFFGLCICYCWYSWLQ